MKQTEIQHLLPEVFQRTAREGSPLYALLSAMEALHTPSEAALKDLDRYFNAYRAPDRFVPFLARWVDLGWLLTGPEDSAEDSKALPLPSGLGRLRELVAAAAFLSAWRGTAKGLVRFLETATGIPGFRIEENPPDDHNVPRAFHLLVHAPAEALAFRSLVERIVEVEKPAYVTFALKFDGADR